MLVDWATSQKDKRATKNITMDNKKRESTDVTDL